MPSILYTASTARHIRDFHMDMLSALKNAGFSVTVACREDTEQLPGLDVFNIPFSKHFFSPGNFRALKKLCALLRQKQFDIVSTHTALAGFITRMALRLSKNRRPFCIHTAHGYLFGKTAAVSGKFTYIFEKLCAPVTDMIMTMNSEDIIYAQKLVKRGGRVVSIRGMGVDTQRFKPPEPDEKLRLRKALGLPEGFLIFCAAEFSTRKNHKTLIRAMPEILRAIPSAHLLLAGDGALYGKIRRAARKQGVLEHVCFLGYIQDTASYLKASDMAVSASFSEGLPAAIQEAILCGVPVAASRVKGHIDLLKNECLFNPRSPRRLARRCIETARDNTRPESYTQRIISKKDAAFDILPYYYSGT